MPLRALRVIMITLLFVFSCTSLPVMAAEAASRETIQTLPSPTGPVVLTVSGDIEKTNRTGEARFDRAMLNQLAARTIVTNTPWHEAVSRFEGPLMMALMEAVGAEGNEVRVGALNGFEARIPFSDFQRYDVILAMRRNGESIPIREFGPLRVIYPFKAFPELHTEMIRFRSVWQVDHIHVY